MQSVPDDRENPRLDRARGHPSDIALGHPESCPRFVFSARMTEQLGARSQARCPIHG